MWLNRVGALGRAEVWEVLLWALSQDQSVRPHYLASTEPVGVVWWYANDLLRDSTRSKYRTKTHYCFYLGVVLVIHISITKLSQNLEAEATFWNNNIYDFTVSEGQESRCSVTGPLSGVIHRLQSAVGRGWRHLRASLKKGPASTLTHVVVSRAVFWGLRPMALILPRLLAGRPLSVSCHPGSSWPFALSEWASHESQRGKDWQGWGHSRLLLALGSGISLLLLRSLP